MDLKRLWCGSRFLRTHTASHVMQKNTIQNFGGIMKRDARKRLKEAKDHSTKEGGEMPMLIVCSTEEELAEMKRVAKGMRGIKHLEIGLKK